MMHPDIQERPPADPRRLRIYDAAEPLFDRFGFRKTTIEEVCRDAGVSKRTFYELFRDKTDLLGHLLMHLNESEFDVWFAELDPNASATDHLLSFLDLYPATYTKHPVMRLAFKELHHSDMSELMEEVLTSPMMRAVEHLIDRGRENREFRDIDTLSAIMIIDAIMDRLYFELPELTGMPGAMDNPVWAREIRTFILAGLLTPERMAQHLRDTHDTREPDR